MKAMGVRLDWRDVAAPVRTMVATVLGSPVVVAENQPGGLSPGVAARCRLADGRRFFLKAVSAEQNPASPGLFRREAEVLKALPGRLPVPALVEVIDTGDWVVLVLEEIEGSPPSLPWSLGDLRTTFGLLDELATSTTPCRIELPPIGARLGSSFRGYRRLAGGDPAIDRIDPWSLRHVDHLADLESSWDAAAKGDSLLHTDLRADNLLVRPDGSMVIVDWPHACIGAAFVDKAFLLPSVALGHGPDPITVERALRPFAGLDDDALGAVLVAVAGYFTFQGAQEDPEGLPTLRAFQRAQGAVARAWVAERLGLG